MSRYRNPVWDLDVPWSFPGILWTLPWWPLRVYLHAGDRVLFWLWWHSRPALWRLEQIMVAPEEQAWRQGMPDD